VIPLQHGRVTLALHPLREAAGSALLCLHAVGGAARDFQDAARLWPGPVFALDFSGHGDSGRLRGGGYFPETLAGDADAALARIGPALLLGAGIGAYVALLLAGARPDAVPGALLLPGAGLEGGGAAPDPASDTLARWTDLGAPLPGCDPAVRRLERDLRPPDYAEAFARAARRLLLAEGDFRQPPWWQAVRSSPTALPVPGDLAAGLARLAAFAHDPPFRSVGRGL
jgi:pimeloyl-ACP methyl ester carboxylesterase